MQTFENTFVWTGPYSLTQGYILLCFSQNDNIGKFLKFCDSIEVTKADQFMTADLIDRTNLHQV